jgi:membrane-associated phospholipid phosphatase
MPPKPKVGIQGCGDPSFGTLRSESSLNLQGGAHAQTGPIMSEPPARPVVSRRWALLCAAAAFALVAALALVIVYREGNRPFGFEVEWMRLMVEHRSEFWTVPALVFNFLGGGVFARWVVPLAVIGALLLWRRTWGAVFVVAAVLLSMVAVQGLKTLIGRPRPADGLVQAGFGAFPSGHSANAAIVAMTLGIVFWRTWVWVAGALYTVAMMLSRTYLGVHWISDTVGAALLSAGIAFAVWALLFPRLERERGAPHPPVWAKPA